MIDIDPIALKTIAILFWFVSLFGLERLYPAARNRKGARRLLTNSGLWLLILLVSPLVVLPLTALAGEHALWTREGWLARWPGLALDIILLDLWAYGVHHAYHVVPAMWRLHLPHHLDETLDSTSALRFHVFEVAFSALLRMAPIFLLAIPFAHVVIFETLLLMGAIFHHSNVRLPAPFERMLSAVIVTPSIHWVHHHAIRADTDSNYGAIFSFWDRLFSTRSATRRTPDMKIGVEGLGERPFLKLLVTPFLKRSP